MARPLPEPQRRKTRAAPHLPPSPSLDAIIEECASRNLRESYDGLIQTRKLLAACRAQTPDLTHATQFGDLEILPNRGAVFAMSDIEGGVGRLREVVGRHDLMQRWALDDPFDRVYLAVLGDSIDRSNTGSVLMEVLFELKRLYPRNIVILPGNHELSEEVQFSRRHGGFYQEVVYERDSYQNIGEFSQNELHRNVKILRGHGTSDEQLARMTVWSVFNDCFKALPLVVSSPGLFMSHAGFPLSVPMPKKIGDFSHYQGDLRDEDLKAMTSYVLRGVRGAEPEPDIDDLPESQADQFIEDMTWSDFDPNLDTRTAFNKERGAGALFSPQALREFRSLYGINVWLRGHQAHAPVHPSILQAPDMNYWSTEGMLTIASNHEVGRKAVYAVVPLGKPNLSVADIAVHILES